MTEMELLNSVRLELGKRGCKSFRTNVGKVKTNDGRWFDTGLPKGFADLLVIRNDGMACFVETKLHPRKPTQEQCNFLLAMIKQGCPAGVAYSVEEALRIVEWKEDFSRLMEHTLRGVLLCRRNSH